MEGINESPSVLYKKALYLEETLEKMQSHSDFIFKKIKRLERQNKPTKGLKKKLSSINKGIVEVCDKADVLWKLISAIDYDSKGLPLKNYHKDAIRENSERVVKE